MMSPRMLLLAAALSALTLSSTRACPQSLMSICKCLSSSESNSTSSGLRIECIDRSLDEVIRSIGGSFEEKINIDRLSIRNTNGITTEIPAGAFLSMTIRDLELTGNNIIRIDDNAFDGTASNLVSLVLKDNSLSVIPKLAAMSNLDTLDLSGNSLTTIPDNAFVNTKKLRRLHFRSNRICKLGPNALNETKERLEYLDLSANCLDEVPAQNLRGSQRLQLLDLSGNKIANVPSLRFMNLPSLVELRLNGNGMRELHQQAFMNVPDLERLTLNDNELPTVDTERFQSFLKLASLDLSNNRLSKISSNAFRNILSLRHLILDDNQIESVETLAFSGLPALQVISLENNGLQRLYRNAFDNLPALTSLLFANNSLDDIGEGTFSGMPALQQLILSTNRLSTLSSGSFDSITQLTTLDLSNNLLDSIGVNVFQSLTKLFWLDLSGNQLSVLPPGVFTTKIANVLLQGNPLVCDQSIDWLIQYLVSNNVRAFLPNQHDVRCADPPEKRGLLLKDLMLQKANDTFYQKLQNGQSNFNRPPNFNVSNPGDFNLIAQQIPGIPAGPLRTEDLLKSLPQLAAMLGNGQSIENMDLTKLPPEIIRYVSQGGQIPGVSKETIQALTQRYMAQMAAKNGASPNGVPTANIPNPINPSGQSIAIIPGPPAPFGPFPPVQLITSAPPSVFIPLNTNNSAVLPSLADIYASGTLPPLNAIPPELIQTVLNGGTIPGLTKEQTEALKQRYMQQIYTAKSESISTDRPRPIEATHIIFGGHNNGNSPTHAGHQVFEPLVTTTTQPPIQFSSSPFFNLTDLQSLNIDLSKIPPEVLRDLAAGRTPDFSKIPQDIIRVIMERRPKLFGEIVSRELRTRAPTNGTKPTISTASTRHPWYDVNELDKKSDISVLEQGFDAQQMTIWTGVALGAIGALTIIAAAVLCWRRRVGQAQQRRASRQTQLEDTSDTSRFFDQHAIKPTTNTLAPEPPPRRSKVKFDEANNASMPNPIDLMFGMDPPQQSTAIPQRGGPVSPYGMDRSGQQIFSIDSSTNRMNNNQIFQFDPLNRQVPGQPSAYQQYPTYQQAQTHFAASAPPLPNRTPARAPVFDHTTGTWMFMGPNGSFN